MVVEKAFNRVFFTVYASYIFLYFWQPDYYISGAYLDFGHQNSPYTLKLDNIENCPLFQNNLSAALFLKHLRNEFYFWNVHGIMNISGLLESK